MKKGQDGAIQGSAPSPQGHLAGDGGSRHGPDVMRAVVVGRRALASAGSATCAPRSPSWTVRWLRHAGGRLGSDSGSGAGFTWDPSRIRVGSGRGSARCTCQLCHLGTSAGRTGALFRDVGPKSHGARVDLDRYRSNAEAADGRLERAALRRPSCASKSTVSRMPSGRRSACSDSTTPSAFTHR